MPAQETGNQQFQQHFEFFKPFEFQQKFLTAASFVKERLPNGFTPRGIITLGSGGLGAVAEEIEQVADPINFKDIPYFPITTVKDHEGKLIPGYLEGFPVIGQKGRIHWYEKGGQPNQVIALKEVTFPVYVARALGAEFYIATNAAGGLNPDYRPGDMMIIRSHNDLHFPNALAGPQVDFMNPPRFQPQNQQYNQGFIKLFHQAARNVGEAEHVHDGVYVAVPGPTYESNADCQELRRVGCDAVGMSTVPEVIVATNLGMETGGFSLISNVVAPDGTNATSNEEVVAALKNPHTMARIKNVTREFFRLLSNN